MRLLWKALGFVAVLIAVLIGAVFLLPADRLGRIASDQMSKQLGRQVVLSDVGLSVWPVLGVQAGGVQIANPEWAGAEPMFTASRAGFGLDPVAALQGRLEFRSITADGPTLRLIQRADRANWQLSDTEAVSSDTSAGGSSFALTTLDQLSITGGRLILDTEGAITELNDADLDLRWPDTNGPMELTARLRPAASAVSIEATLQKPRAMMAGGAGPVAARVTTDGGTVGFDGLAGSAPEAQGTLTLNLTDTARMTAAFGQLGIALPDGLGQSITGQMALTLTREGRLALRDAALTLDGNAVTFLADIELGAKPRVNAQITAQSLDLSGLTGGSGEAAPSDGWSNAKIDASGLASFDGEISLVTDALKLDPLSFGKTRALLTLDKSRAVFELRELQGYNGLITGDFVVNNRSGLSTRANLAFAGVALKDLLSDTMDVSRLSGASDGSVSLLASGGSVAALVASLSGDGALRAGPGVIEGIDLAAAVGGKATGGTTVFDQATGTFTVTKGVLKSDDLTMALPRLTARGTGRIDLGQRTLDYLLTILAPQARAGRGLAIPVRVKGPWSSPAISVDAGEALNANFSEEREAIEQKARARVNDALEDKLGVTVQEGQSVEDALRNNLEQRAKDGLLNLLNK